MLQTTWLVAFCLLGPFAVSGATKDLVGANNVTLRPENSTQVISASSTPAVLISMADIFHTEGGKRSWSEYDHSKSSGTNVYIIAIIGVVPAAGALLWCIRKALKASKENNKPQQEQEQPQEGQLNYGYLRSKAKSISTENVEYNAPTPMTVLMPPEDEVPRGELQLQDVLGEGNFGRVLKATACKPDGHTTQVAVKTLKEYASSEEKRDLLREMRVMRELGKHPNVVAFIGYCTQQEPLLLVMELVAKGKLLSFLREHRSKGAYYNDPEGDGSLGPRDLAMFALQVCHGMHYIASKGVIHRDLAARNVLVDEHNRCKVADFGLSRTVKDTDVYEQKTKGALPVRWLAPECLYLQVFTTKSDVWAFGILLWEIVTLGSTPYPGMCARQVMQEVRDGHVMSQPAHCGWELYRVMRSCWHPNPAERPTFSQLRADLDKLIKLNAGYIDLDNFPEHAYYNMYYGIDEKV